MDSLYVNESSKTCDEAQYESVRLVVEGLLTPGSIPQLVRRGGVFGKNSYA